MKVSILGGKVILSWDGGEEALSPNEARRLALAMFQHADQISKANKRRRKRKRG